MNKLIFLLILACQIAVTAPISAEEIKFTTIIPDQTILRTKKAAIGNTYSNPGPLTGGIPDSSIPTSGLLVEGNVGIGTGTTPLTAKLEVSGNMRLAPTAQPASPQPGMIYYDLVANIMRYHNGTTWVDVGGGGGGAFRSWISFDNTWWGLNIANSTYDHFVVASAGNCFNLRGFSGIPNPITASGDPFVSDVGVRCITFPIRKGDDWRVNASGGSNNKVLSTLDVGN